MQADEAIMKAVYMYLMVLTVDVLWFQRILSPADRSALYWDDFTDESVGLNSFAHV